MAGAGRLEEGPGRKARRLWRAREVKLWKVDQGWSRS